jgi:hypothetical protein
MDVEGEGGEDEHSIIAPYIYDARDLGHPCIVPSDTTSFSIIKRECRDGLKRRGGNYSMNIAGCCI